jgi:hypothetical protein
MDKKRWERPKNKKARTLSHLEALLLLLLSIDQNKISFTSFI